MLGRPMKPKFVVINTHPIQYYAPLYRELSARDKVDLHVVFLSDVGAVAHLDPGFGQVLAWDIPLMEGYSYTVLEPGMALQEAGFWARSSSKLVKILNELDPDAIQIHGYASKMNWIARSWAIRRRRRIVYTSDSNARNSRSKIIDFLKTIVVSRFFRGVDCFLSTSEANEDYVLRFGAKKESVVRTPFSIEYSRWSEGSGPAGGARKYHFAWAGKFVSVKRPIDFIKALEIVCESVEGGVDAICIGDGPLRSQMEAAVAALPGACRVDMVGFINQKEMPAALQQAHVFVFSSEAEAYGLIATEAAAAGLALVVADRIGCVGDTVLAREGVNSLTYPAGDVSALAAAMLKVMLEPENRTKMQQSSQDIARAHDISVAAAMIEDVLLNRHTEQSRDRPSK